MQMRIVVLNVTASLLRKSPCYRDVDLMTAYQMQISCVAVCNAITLLLVQLKHYIHQTGRIGCGSEKIQRLFNFIKFNEYLYEFSKIWDD